MTGYGRGEAPTADGKVIAEIRSLNGKSLDLSLRSPQVYRPVEAQLRTAVAAGLLRGKVDLTINFDGASATTVGVINKSAFKSYYRELTAAAREIGYNLADEPLMATIMRMPDVVSGERTEVSDEEFKAVISAVNGAIASLDKFRLQEGAVLMSDIMARVAKIGELLQTVEQFEAERIETVRARLNENLTKAQVNVDTNRFESEIIYYLEKFDVTEEKVRLGQHIAYFGEVASDGGDTGRKLGFIAQEMGREINTLGSKANHSEMQKVVVQMKDELEKIKEQLLNVL